MLDFSRHQLFFRFVTFVVIMAMFPMSVNADMLGKAVGAPAVKSAKAEKPVAADKPLGPPKQLSKQQMKKIAGLPSITEQTREHIRDKINVPPIKDVVEKIQAARTAPPAELAAGATSETKTLSRTELQKTTGGENVENVLNQSREQVKSGSYLDAALSLINLQNNYSRTWGAVEAGKELDALLTKLMQGGITPALQAEFAARFPSFSDVQSVEARLTIVGFLFHEAMLADASGQKDAAKEYHSLCRDAAWQMMQQDQDHPAQAAYAVNYFFQSSEAIGEADKAAEQLRSLAQTLKPCMVKQGVYYFLGFYMSRHENSRELLYLNWSDMAAECGPDVIDAIVHDPGVNQRTKAMILSRLSYACYYIGDLERALQLAELQIKECPNDADDAYYGRAQIIANLHPDQPATCIEAYMEGFEKSDQHDDLMLFGIATTYYRCEEYASAADILRDLISQYPGSRGAVAAENLLDFMVRWQMVGSDSDPKPEEAKTLAMCGPYALQSLLTMQGIQTSADELAAFAGTTETGTSMYSLLETAANYGVALNGVQAKDISQLETPFIAFVNGNHFVLVKQKLDARMILVADMDKREAPMAVSELAAIWDGKALVLQGNSEVPEMDNNEMQTTRGGCLPFVYPPPPPPPPPCCGSCPANSSSAPASSTVNVFLSAQYKDETDLQTSNIGARLAFKRTFYNPMGLMRTDIIGDTPWQNNIGRDWNHNYNYRVHTSYYTSDGVPTKAIVFDPEGAGEYYANPTADGAGNHVYSIEGTSRTTRLSYKLLRNATTGKFTLKVPDGTQYGFSAISTDGNRIAHLDWVKDISGNQTALSYDNAAIATGKLTKIAAPAPDDRYIRLSYSGYRITKAELKNATSTLAQVQYAYNANADLTKVTTSDGSEHLYAYASTGGVTNSHYMNSVTDPRGNTSTYTLNYAYDNVSSKYVATKVNLTTPDNVLTVYERDLVAGQNSTNAYVVKSIAGTVLAKSKYGNTVNGVFIGKKDFWYDVSSANATKSQTFQYANGRDLTRSIKPDGVTDKTYTYTALGMISTEKDAYNQGKTHYYDSTGLYLTKIRDAVGLDTTLAYDALHRITNLTKPSGESETFQYDNYGRITRRTDSLNNATVYAYDTHSNVTSITDPNNLTTTLAYDGLGHATQVTDPRGKSTSYQYAAACGSCGSAGKVTKIIDALSNETEIRYDANGNVTKEIDPLDHETDYAYDAMNNVTLVTAPSGSANTMAYAYDLLNRRTKVTDFNGKIMNLKYDFMDRVVTKTVGTSPEELVQRWVYDDAGNIINVYDGAGTPASFYYDQCDRPTREITAGKTERHYFDAASRLTKTGASDGTVDPLEYSYDGATGLMTSATFTNGANVDTVHFYYDGAARKTKVSDWTGTNGLEYAYDAGGRVTLVTDHNNSDQTMTYTYDNAGNVVTMVDWHGNTTTYTYTDTDRISTLSAPGGKTWTYAYNAMDERSQITVPNGMTNQFLYDNLNRLTKIDSTDGGTAHDSFTYSFDGGNSITRTVHEDGSYWDYGYDARYRLTSAVRTNVDQSTTNYAYTYDSGENLVTKVEAGVNTTYEFDTMRLTSMTSGGTTTKFTYDDHGRQISKYQEGSYSATYGFRYDNKLHTVTSDFPGEGNMTNDYDGTGALRAITTSLGTKYLRWDAGAPIMNLDKISRVALPLVAMNDMDDEISQVASALVLPPTQEKVISKFHDTDKVSPMSAGAIIEQLLSWGGGWHVLNAEDGNAVLAMSLFNDPEKPIGNVLAANIGSDPSQDGIWGYLLQDTIGSTRTIRADDASLLGAYEFTPYGESFSSQGLDLPMKFTGHWWMPQSQMYYTPYRMYIPSQARWLTKDPLGVAAGINTYGYVKQDPILNFDPRGLDWCHDCVCWIGKTYDPNTYGEDRNGNTGIFIFSMSMLLYLWLRRRVKDSLRKCPKDE